MLNVSANQLSVLPGVVEASKGGRSTSPICRKDSGSAGTPNVTLSLQELYAAANQLRDLTPLQHCRALRILHVPYNQISNLQDRYVL